jgi:cytoskeletal protein CcmA (bactofilin family)
MFREKKGASAVGAINTLLGDGSRLKGTVECEGTMRLDGKVDGKVLARDSVIVGETGIIKADIMAPNIVIGGKVTGNVTAENRVELLPSAQLYGDIQTPILAIAEGVVFQGNCNMKGKVEPREKVKAEGEPIEVKKIKE